MEFPNEIINRTQVLKIISISHQQREQILSLQFQRLSGLKSVVLNDYTITFRNELDENTRGNQQINPLMNGRSGTESAMSQSPDERKGDKTEGLRYPQ
jgi:hypothetical protein